MNVQRITLPARLDEAGLARLEAQLEAACVGDARALVLESREKDFCEGAQIADFAGAPPDIARWLRSGANCLLAIRRSPALVVAAVEGRAAGFGVGLVSACDVVIAGPNASFYLPEMALGLLPLVVMPFLLRRLTSAKAQYLASSLRPISASEAHAAGLADELATDLLDDAVGAQLKRLSRSMPEAQVELKRRLSAVPILEQLVEEAIDASLAWLDRPDVRDGILQFATGFRPPWFATAPGVKT